MPGTDLGPHGDSGTPRPLLGSCTPCCWPLARPRPEGREVAGLAWLTRLGSSAELPAPSGPKPPRPQALLGDRPRPSAALVPDAWPEHPAPSSPCPGRLSSAPLDVRVYTEMDLGFGT